MGKRELVTVLYLSSWCLVVVVIVVFPVHTHLLCYYYGLKGKVLSV